MTDASEKEKYLTALRGFDAAKGISSEIIEVVDFVAKSGCNCFPWDLLKPALFAQLNDVLVKTPPQTQLAEDKQVEYAADRATALGYLSQFSAAPFTLQRLCEILVDKAITSGRKDKLVWAILKLVCIATTIPVEPFPFERQSTSETTSTGIADLLVEDDVPMPPPAPVVISEPEPQQDQQMENTEEEELPIEDLQQQPPQDQQMDQQQDEAPEQSTPPTVETTPDTATAT